MFTYGIRRIPFGIKEFEIRGYIKTSYYNFRRTIPNYFVNNRQSNPRFTCRNIEDWFEVNIFYNCFIIKGACLTTVSGSCISIVVPLIGKATIEKRQIVIKKRKLFIIKPPK